ncbi:MAG TPA: carboxypeptidase-like regulatory domain-containing protein [Candidatus Acidoferrum sp.]
MLKFQAGNIRVWLWPAGLLSLNLVLLCVPSFAGQSAPLPAAPQAAPSVSGRVVDPSGVGVVGATIKLTGADQAASQEAATDNDGRFMFAHAAPGPVQLTIISPGFAPQEFSGNVAPDAGLAIPQITLAIASLNTEVRVVPVQVIAAAQLKEEEKQRALGIIPNYYVSYVPNAAPLSSGQKFHLAWKTIVDPVTFGITGVIAGLQQAQGDFSGYGQGAQGYAKRYGAGYADTVTSTLIGGAILPSLFKQDPRYFYKGTGSKKSRLLYAIANSVICKGDNGHWQANYSGLLGSLAAGGISNLYYPATDRDAGLTFQNALIGIGANAAANILQEFVIKKLTPNVPSHDPGNAGSGKPNLVGKVFGSFVHSGD